MQFKAPPREAYLPPHKTPFEVTAHLALRFDGNKRYTSNAHDTFGDPASYSCGGQSTHAEIRHIDANRPSEAHIDHPFLGLHNPRRIQMLAAYAKAVGAEPVPTSASQFRRPPPTAYLSARAPPPMDTAHLALRFDER